MQQLLLLAPSVIAFAWLASRAQWFWNHRPDLQFGWGVLVLCILLFWMAWEKRPALRCRWSFGGAILGIFGVGLLFLTQIYQAAFGMMAASLSMLAAGVFLVIAANVVYVFGWAGLRHFAFAFLFIITALPMPSLIYNLVVSNLQSLVASLNVEILRLAGVPAMQVGSLIQLPVGTVGIDEACSGIRSLQSSVMATLFIGYLKLKHRSLQCLLLGLGIGFSILGNLIRSLYLSFTANAKGIGAIKDIHDAAGWSILLFTLGGVVVSAWALNRLVSRAALARERSTFNIEH